MILGVNLSPTGSATLTLQPCNGTELDLRLIECLLSEAISFSKAINVSDPINNVYLSNFQSSYLKQSLEKRDVDVSYVRDVEKAIFPEQMSKIEMEKKLYELGKESRRNSNSFISERTDILEKKVASIEKKLRDIEYNS